MVEVLEEKPRVAGGKLPSAGERRKSQNAKMKTYVKEEDPNYLPPDWEEDLVEVVFRFDECEGASYSASPHGYKFTVKDGERVMLPKKVVEAINDNCRIYKRDKVQKDPSQPSRWMKSKDSKRRCHFEPVNIKW